MGLVKYIFPELLSFQLSHNMKLLAVNWTQTWVISVAIDHADHHYGRSIKFSNHQVKTFFNWGQCDQIGRFFALKATIQSQLQQLFHPNCTHCQAIFVKVSKSFILIVTSFLGNFYRHLAIFFWSHLFGLFIFVISFTMTLTVHKNYWKDSNRGSSVSEATALPTVPHPLAVVKTILFITFVKSSIKLSQVKSRQNRHFKISQNKQQISWILEEIDWLGMVKDRHRPTKPKPRHRHLHSWQNDISFSHICII